ncbi:MAG: LLM class flavin-dependent oxidoreductase [Candidatus Rokubacteria bacterium]|nr:LLM class flavin-dependent oxidoreductase [Candidatus Rokubacteria bacterium]
MTRGSLRVGITTMATEPPDRFRALVQFTEESGFDELWVCDSSLHARDVYASLALVATGSRRLRFGPNCTVAGPAGLWIERLTDVVARGIRHLNILLLSADKLSMVKDLGEKVLPDLRAL